MINAAVVSTRRPDFDCRAEAGDLSVRWRYYTAVVPHQPADRVSRQRRQRGLMAAPGGPHPVQSDEARAAAGLSIQLGR